MVIFSSPYKRARQTAEIIAKNHSFPEVNIVYDKGGNIVAIGTPEEVSEVKESYTGQYLKKVLNNGKWRIK